MIEHLHIRAQIHQSLQTGYVALLGQRGIGVKTTMNSLLSRQQNLHGMQYVPVSLPLDVSDERDFKEILVERLITSSANITPAPQVALQVQEVVQKNSRRSVDIRLRKVLDTMAKEADSAYLVLVLRAFCRIEESPLRKVLHLLRDYHTQMQDPTLPGSKLRFLVSGDEQLWTLCYHRTNERISPFNIATRVFLDGLSAEDIQRVASIADIETAQKLRTLTAGIPTLLEDVINDPEANASYLSFFPKIQQYWNMLHQTAQEVLKRLAHDEEAAPICFPDEKCPEVPDVDAPWREAFWGGFLQFRQQQLGWRSPIHHAFVMHIVKREQNLRLRAAKWNLSSRIEHLERNATDFSALDESVAEGLSLARELEFGDLADALAMVQAGATAEQVSERVRSCTYSAGMGWLRAFFQTMPSEESNIPSWLLRGTVIGAKRWIHQFDVFLCHRGTDKGDVKDIGAKLMLHGILPWLDEWELPPGQPWKRLVEEHIPLCRSAAVFIGEEGVDRWQTEEEEAFLSEFVARRCPVIPVILAKCQGDPRVSLFLKNRTWVDFRKPNPDPLAQLCWGVKDSQLLYPKTG